MLVLLTLLQDAHAVQEAGGHEGGAAGGPFSINPGLIIWTLVVFAILLVLLWRFAFPAIVKSVEERERRIQKQLEDAEKDRKQITAARNEAQDILGKAKTVAQKERETLLAKAREEYDALLTRARKDIEAEKDKALVALRSEAVELSIAAASRVIEANLDNEANRRLVSEFLESVGKEKRK